MKKLSYILLIAVVFLSFCGFDAPLKIAEAAETVVIDYDYTNVLDDLASSSTGGVDFNVTDYPAAPEGELQFITFAEYAYSTSSARRGHYGLYVYLYNPAGIEYLATASGHKIQMAVKYNENGSPIDYEKFDLKILSISTAPYANRFIKLKVVDRKSSHDGKTIAERVNQNSRRYDISGVELISKNAVNATEKAIALTFVYSGFAEGYGPTVSPSTLTCEVHELETISLQVNHTYFRTGLSLLGLDHQNQLESVYFGVDSRFLEEYGRLQRVKAEWYEYNTQPIVVTQHEDAYNNLLSKIGIYQEAIEYGLYGRVVTGDPLAPWEWAYTTAQTSPEIMRDTVRILYYLFYTPDIETYDPRSDEAVIGGVKSNKLYEYIMQYDKSFESGSLPIKNGTVSQDLFTDSVDDARIHLFNDLEEGRKNGYYIYDFDADVDLHQMPSYNSSNPDFIQKVRDFGFWNTIFNNLPDLDDSYSNVSPIYKVSDHDLIGSNADISTRLLIREADVNKFKTYYADEKSAGREVFLFRFATTDYYSTPLTIRRAATETEGPENIEDEAYMTRQTVFLDFDIIQLTFNKQGVYTVIPVINSPIDAVADLTPPAYIPAPVINQFWNGIKSLFNAPDMPEWLDQTLKIIATVIVVVIAILLIPILIPILRAIFKGLWWLLKLPILAIKRTSKTIKERRKKKKATKKARKEKEKLKPKKVQKVAKVKNAKKIKKPKIIANKKNKTAKKMAKQR